MSKLIRVDGDLVKMAKASEFDVIVHGCNCFNTMAQCKGNPWNAGILYSIMLNAKSKQ